MNLARGLLLTLAVGGTPVLAQSPVQNGDTERMIVVDTASQFADSVARIRAEMEPGGRYGYIKDSDRSLVEARLEQMEIVFVRTGPAHAMSHDQRLELVDRKRQIVEVLSHYDNNSLACETHPNIGCAFR